ncbi:uncharacterized protein LOC113312484 [Papaver somniferum]|uniref:uncharacterized protein LOC113312484 n=1 Tax=Papaver somniferum TaxID=3469 RepID=UPI000E70079B|nr:uncharacterized protein LOC113312484 [Papaver somniferum]
MRIPYKLQIFMWKVIRNALPVKANFHITTADDNMCVLCNTQQIEDINHLLFSCLFANAIWKNCLPQHFNYVQQFSTLQEWIASWPTDSIINFTSDTPSLHGMIATILHIWKYRCKVQFQQETVNPNSALLPLFKYLADIVNITHASHTIHHVEHVCHWSPPPPDSLKINVDASFHKPFHVAGIVMLTRNSTGSYVAGKGVLRRVNHVHLDESWALLEAMHWAIQNNWNKVIFESDCKNVVLPVNEGLLPYWQSSPLLNKCVKMCNSHNSWFCVYVPRVCNKAVDCLAKSVLRSYNPGEWWFVPSTTLYVKLANDVS